MARRQINDSNWREVLKQDCPLGVIPRKYLNFSYGSDEAIAREFKPFGDYPDKVIPRDEWPERITEMREKKAFPSQHWEEAKVPKKSQNGFGYCWGFSLASTDEMSRLMEGQPYVQLSGTCCGELVNWRNAGYYLAEALAYAREHGICEEALAPDSTINPRKFDPTWKENRAKYKPDEVFDTNSIDHMVSLLLLGVPGYIAYDWWGHALCAVGLKNSPRNLYGITWEILNSHDDGIIELSGNRGVPDEFYGIASTTFSR